MFITREKNITHTKNYTTLIKMYNKTDKKISIIIDESLHKKLKHEAKIHNVSINKYLNKLITDVTESKLFDEKKNEII